VTKAPQSALGLRAKSNGFAYKNNGKTIFGGSPNPEIRATERRGSRRIHMLFRVDSDS